MDYIQLQRWGFIEPKVSSKNPEAKDAGYWKITSVGISFVENKITMPRAAYVVNNSTYKWDNIHINIKQALGTKFSYSELLNN